jgi:hypothetical protein
MFARALSGSVVAAALALGGAAYAQPGLSTAPDYDLIYKADRIDDDADNGLGNVIIGYNAGAGAQGGSHNLVVGDGHTLGGSGGLVVGEAHSALADGVALVGGQGNSAAGRGAVVLAGSGLSAGADGALQTP